LSGLAGCAKAHSVFSQAAAMKQSDKLLARTLALRQARALIANYIRWLEGLMLVEPKNRTTQMEALDVLIKQAGETLRQIDEALK
jgi:hypothetical protein